MKKLVRVTLHGITAEGINARVAKAIAQEELTKAIARLNHGPITARVESMGRVAVTMAIPDTTGWRYMILCQPGKPMPTGDLSLKCSSFGRDEDPGDIRASLTRHAAQMAWDHDQGGDAEWSFDASIQCGVLARTVWQDLRLWCMFQRAYRKATLEGKTPHEAHMYAAQESTYEKLEAA